MGYGRVAHFVHECADAGKAGVVVGLAEIDGAADLGVHFCAAQLFGGNFLADCGLHERGTGEKEPGAFGHEDVIGHDGKIGTACDAHAHDCGELRNAHGGHHGVIAEDAAEIVGVREDVFLERQKNAGGIDEINYGNAIFDGDVLRADDLFCGHREEGAGFYGGVVGDDHKFAAANLGESGDGARRRRAAPFFVHFVSGVEGEFEERRAGVNQFCDALAGGKAAFLVL